LFLVQTAGPRARPESRRSNEDPCTNKVNLCLILWIFTEV
jgi:hypothetical protein